MKLVGRINERAIIDQCRADDQPHFIAIYGRRRVGKTFLVRQHFDNKFAFYVTGLANGNKATQLANFHLALNRDSTEPSPLPSTWLEAFNQLIIKLKKSRVKKKVIFIDELPWMDTPRSGFITGLEYFWNSWASAQSDILLIGCGSTASWMLNKLINNKRGLYNRVTRRIKLQPFTIGETEAFLRAKKYRIDRYQMAQLYMVFGGIPFYLDLINPQQSVAQNINHLCFSKDASLKEEYKILFKSLFGESDLHREIVEALAGKRIGLSRKEVLAKVSIKDGGGFKRALSELESSDFIRQYTSFGKSKRDSVFQLIDPFVLFHHQHISKAINNKDYWISKVNTPAINAWQGNAFEMICLLHTDQIKDALGIGGVATSVSAWWGKNAQIDLVIDREDRVINLVEAKFSINEFEVTKAYDANLRNKVYSFMTETGTKKSVWLVLLTTFGLSSNMYSNGIQQVVTLDDLF